MTGMDPNFVPAGTTPRIAGECFIIAKSDTALFAHETAGIYVGTTGHVTIVRRNGSTVQFKNVPAGFILPVNSIGVMLTGTTASDMVGLV